MNTKSAFLFLNNIYNNKRLLLAFIFFASFIVSLIFLVLLGNIGPSQHNIPGTDYLSFYEPVASNILQGDGITLKGEVGLRYPPGYPVILAAIFGLSALLGIGKLSLVIVFNIVVTAGAACFLFLIAQSIFNKRIALTAVFLWLSYPLNLWFIKNPNTEVPFIFLLYLGIWLFILSIKKRHFGFIFLAGVIFGFSALIRPIGLLLPLLPALFIFFGLKESSKGKQFLLAVILLLGVLTAILPWEGYVSAKTNQVIPLSTSGPTAIVDGLTFAVKEGGGGDQAKVPSDVKALMKRVNREDFSSWGGAFQFIGQELINRPVAFLKLVGLKLTRAWYATSQMWWEGKILIVQLIYLIPGFLGIIYALRKYKDKVHNIIFLLGIIFYFWFMTVLALSILRYMIPAMGLMIIFSAVTASILIDKIKLFPKTKF
ncbi:MAG: glycosyltransferase family 39 protein [bacterium]